MYYPPSGSIRYPAPFETLSFSQDLASPAPSSDQTAVVWNTPSVVTQFLSIEDIIREVVTGVSAFGDLVVPSEAPSSLSTTSPEQDLSYSLTLGQARRVLSRFVTQLRQKLERSTRRLITDLERLKFLYLCPLYCFLRAPRGAESWGCPPPPPPPPDPVSPAAAAAPEVAARRLLMDEETEGVAAGAKAAEGADDARAPPPAA